MPLATEIRTDLNRHLPRPYYARLEMRPEIGIVGESDSRTIIPDVVIVRRPRPATAPLEAANVAILDEPRVDPSPSIWMDFGNEPLRHFSVEVRDSAHGHSLVTLIEIASPTNKRSGPDQRAYEAKQQEILESDTSLVELDLLRSGRPVIGGPRTVEAIWELDPRPDYLIAINRAWQRGKYELYPVRLEECLPCILVPLRKDEKELPLDLQYIFRQVYDGGPFARGAVDYTCPPDPPVRPELTNWLAARLVNWR